VAAATFLGAVALLALCGLTISIVMAVAGAKAEKRCIEAGYPAYRVTWNLDVYCMTLDGAVQARVERLP
jgi:hypothetical protein